MYSIDIIEANAEKPNVINVHSMLYQFPLTPQLLPKNMMKQLKIQIEILNRTLELIARHRIFCMKLTINTNA